MLLIKPFFLLLASRGRKREKESERLALIFILEYIRNSLLTAGRVVRDKCLATTDVFIICAGLWVRGNRLGILLPFGIILDMPVIHNISWENVSNLKWWKIVPFNKNFLGHVVRPPDWKDLDMCCVSPCTSHPWALQCPGQRVCPSPLQLAVWKANAVAHSPFHHSWSGSRWI